MTLALHDAPGALPGGQRVYAIGDVLGCATPLRDLHARIAEEFAARPVARAALVHLGDLIDKGEDSAGALQPALAPPIVAVSLLGNHEDYVLAALAGDRGALRDFRDYGGGETLRSWGIAPDAEPEEWAAPERHLAFIRAMPLTHRVGDYLFVHAGIRPGDVLGGHSRSDLLTTRRSFLDSAADPGRLSSMGTHRHQGACLSFGPTGSTSTPARSMVARSPARFSKAAASPSLRRDARRGRTTMVDP